MMASYGLSQDIPRIKDSVNKRTHQQQSAPDEKLPSWQEKQHRRVILFSPVQISEYDQGTPYQNECYKKVREPAKSKKISKAFPQALHEMLQAAEPSGFQEIVSWQPHGRAFRVHDKKQFVSRILPVYFCMSKFTSFQRQLNLYCFHRITTGKDKGASYHELFQRDQPCLYEKMVRKRIKGNGARAAADPEEEPNFYNSQESKLATPSAAGHPSAIEWGFHKTIEKQQPFRNKPEPAVDANRIYTGNRQHARRDSLSLLSSRPYFQPDYYRPYYVGSQLEPLNHCCLAAERLCNSDQQGFSASTRLTAFQSLPADDKLSLRNGMHFDNLNSDSKLSVRDDAHSTRSEINSLCSSQDEDIVSFCSEDWLTAEG